ncbi:MAG: iron export ABC transporter permease subunit FetB [Proteobacteria bacterium]|nr:iron export ABC transporter permease subunit FetB [Pseudomonadota bacterium]
MNTGIMDIGPVQLGIALMFVVIAGAASIYHSLKLERDLLVGTIRTFAQLYIMGYVLKLIFRLNTASLVIMIFAFMIIFAAWTIHGRIKEKQISFFTPVLISMLISYFLVAFLVTRVVIGVDPWWTPRYFLPLGGMVIGNSMNAIAIALERLLNELRSGRKEVEMKLSLGADYKEASRSMFGNAIRAGMIPSINSMMAVGMVFIPGMMTGQIVAGADPMLAIKYQIVVMIMLVGSTTIGTLIAVLITRKLCFSKNHQLLLTRQNKH